MNPQAEEFIYGVKALNIPRAEDLPYKNSPPVQFVYESEATLSLGRFVWDDAPSELVPNRPIMPNALYYFRNVTLTADISGDDFTAALSQPVLNGENQSPKFQMHLVSQALVPQFREPLVMNQFYQQFDYRLFWKSQQGNEGQDGSDEMRASFRGAITQTPALIGLTSVTLKAVVAAQEIVDENFIELFETKYPKSPREVA